MNVLTVTRDYGAGGYEVAHDLAMALGWETLDRELLHRVANLEHLSDAEVERFDEKAISLTDRFRLHPPHQKYIEGLGRVAQEAAAKGNVILVGRGTGQLLTDVPNVFHLRLTAPREWRARRMAQMDGWTLDEALDRTAAQDGTRDRFTRYFFGDAPFHPTVYHAIFNTGRVPLADVVACVASLLRNEAASGMAGTGRRVLTLSRELGTGETSLATVLAARLGLTVFDRERIEQAALRRGLSRTDLEKIDEQPSGILQRFHPGELHRRYFEALLDLMAELASGGGVLFAGRAANQFLRGDPRAFHVHAVAPMDARVRHVMERRWARESHARQLIAESDERRSHLLRWAFDADWADPLEYHLTVNTGRLGPDAVELIALAAGLHWGAGQGA
jgi:cytidylate kinase